MERHLEVSATFDQLRRVCDFVVEAARSAGLSERSVHHCELAVDETCTNIIQHGLPLSEGEKPYLHITTRQEAAIFVIVISDNCQPFNPLGFEKHDKDMHEPGGWGIHFLKNVMDEVTYAYYDGQNHLTLTKEK